MSFAALSISQKATSAGLPRACAKPHPTNYSFWQHTVKYELSLFGVPVASRCRYVLWSKRQNPYKSISVPDALHADLWRDLMLYLHCRLRVTPWMAQTCKYGFILVNTSSDTNARGHDLILDDCSAVSYILPYPSSSVILDIICKHQREPVIRSNSWEKILGDILSSPTARHSSPAAFLILSAHNNFLQTPKCNCLSL